MWNQNRCGRSVLFRSQKLGRYLSRQAIRMLATSDHYLAGTHGIAEDVLKRLAQPRSQLYLALRELLWTSFLQHIGKPSTPDSDMVHILIRIASAGSRIRMGTMPRRSLALQVNTRNQDHKN